MDVLTSLDRARCVALRERDEFFWADLESPPPDQLVELGEMLGLHPLAMEDTREFGQPVKLDNYGDHVLLVFYTARECRDDADAPFQPTEVHVYVSGGFIVTVRRARSPELEALHARLEDGTPRSEEQIVYSVLDALTDGLLHVSDLVEGHIDSLEAEVLDRVLREHARRIYRLKQVVRDLLRRAIHQRDRFDSDVDAILAIPGLEVDQRRYLADVRDHLVLAVGELSRQSDDLQALTGTYYNANSERLNLGVARLTVVSAFFVVWTVITGFFGQNFGWLVRNIETRHDFLVYGVGTLLASTVLISAVLWWRRRDLL